MSPIERFLGSTGLTFLLVTLVAAIPEIAVFPFDHSPFAATFLQILLLPILLLLMLQLWVRKEHRTTAWQPLFWGTVFSFLFAHLFSPFPYLARPILIIIFIFVCLPKDHIKSGSEKTADDLEAEERGRLKEERRKKFEEQAKREEDLRREEKARQADQFRQQEEEKKQEEARQAEREKKEEETRGERQVRLSDLELALIDFLVFPLSRTHPMSRPKVREFKRLFSIFLSETRLISKEDKQALLTMAGYRIKSVSKNDLNLEILSSRLETLISMSPSIQNKMAFSAFCLEAFASICLTDCRDEAEVMVWVQIAGKVLGLSSESDSKQGDGGNGAKAESEAAPKGIENEEWARKTLGVSVGASRKEINNAFREKAKRSHSDKLQEFDTAIRKFADKRFHEFKRARDILLGRE